MALTNKSLTQQIGVRCTQDLLDTIEVLQEETGMDKAGAARVLMERGAKQIGHMDMKEIQVIYFNARSAALHALAQVISDAVDTWREE